AALRPLGDSARRQRRLLRPGIAIRAGATALLLPALVATLPANETMMPPIAGSLSWSNGYGSFNRVNNNHMHHTALDLVGTEGVTVVRAADAGLVSIVQGLAVDHGGPEYIAVWTDTNANQRVDPGEIAPQPFLTGRQANNYGFGIVIVIDHGNGISSLYGHLHAVSKAIYDAVVVADGTLTISQGDPIGVLGNSAYDLYTGG